MGSPLRGEMKHIYGGAWGLVDRGEIVVPILFLRRVLQIIALQIAAAKMALQISMQSVIQINDGRLPRLQ